MTVPFDKVIKSVSPTGPMLDSSIMILSTPTSVLKKSSYRVILFSPVIDNSLSRTIALFSATRPGLASSR